MSSTFKVSKVDSSKDLLKKVGTVTDSFKVLTGSDVEASGSSTGAEQLVRTWQRSPMHPFLGTLHGAFDKHYSVAISPDDIWLCIAQGFAQHVNLNSEELRKQFVQHDGKVTLLHENKYTKGSPKTDWTQSFSWFSNEIEKHIGKKRDLIVSGFSTTGPIELAASEIVLMEAMQNFFDYREFTRCGIPEITLLGTVEDWKSVRTRTNNLSEFGLGWWTEPLSKVLDEFVLAVQNKPNSEFWQSFYKWQNGSGGPRITGLVNSLFPYVKNHKKNWEKNTATGPWAGYGPTDYPIGLSVVPFIWDYYGTEYEMDFLGGFAGTVQDSASLQLKTSIGWAVRDRPKNSPTTQTIEG